MGNNQSNQSRFLEIIRILRKYKIRQGMDPVKFRQILEDLGPTYVKIGQIMSTRQDMFSERYCKELMKLRSSVTPMSFDTVQSVIEKTYGKPLRDIFSVFEQEPLGSASIAQVHMAYLPDGKKVVVKIQRPDIYNLMARDVRLMRRAIKVLNISDVISSVVDLDMVIDEFWATAQEEMDFSVEATFAKRFKETYKDIEYIDAPIIYDEYSSKHVLVMEYIDGIEISDITTLEQEGYSTKEIAEKLAYNYISQIIEHGFFHADPHSGNLRIRNDQIVWIDFGMMGTLNRRERIIMKDAIRAIAMGDTMKVVDSILAIGVCDREIDYTQFSLEIENFMSSYLSQSFSDIDLAKMTQDIFTICHVYHIQLPKGISMLARSMLTIQATLMDLDADTNMMTIASNHKETLIQLDLWKTTKKTLQRGLEASSRTLDIPVQTSDILRMVQRGQVKMNLNLMGSDQPIAKIDRMVNRLIVCLLIVALLVGSSILCMTDMSPKILGIPAIGFVGYIIAFIMSIWLFFKMLFLHRRNKMF